MAFMGDRAKDRDRYRVWQTGQLARIEDRETGAMIRCLGSDPRRAHGLAPSLILADEPAQWPRSSGERMVAALMTALGKIQDARLIALGTRPAGTDHWFAKALAGAPIMPRATRRRPRTHPSNAGLGRKQTRVSTICPILNRQSGAKRATPKQTRRCFRVSVHSG